MQGDHRLMRTLFFLVSLLMVASPVPEARADAINSAISDAIALFERAAPRLSATHQGVDVTAFRDALTLGRFTSGHWGGEIALDVSEQESTSGSCARFAAFVRIPPQQGRVSLVFCPQFSA